VDNFLPGCRFDAYAATVPVHPRDLLEALEGITPSSSWVRLPKAPQGYAFASQLRDDDGPLGVAFWGGMHEHPHASFQGEASPAAASVLRECFPRHSVTRCDPIIVESTDAGAYDRLQGIAVQVAERHRVTVGTAGDHLVTMEGRTCYLGSTQSVVRLRLYDKAAELRAKLRDPAKLATVPPELARMEAQIRPQGVEAKAAAAIAEPAQLLGSARWLRDVCARVVGVELEPFSAWPSWRETDDSRAWAAAVKQYGPLFSRMAADLGSWECLGLQIRDDLARFAEAKRTR
jgi:hypothetical protein